MQRSATMPISRRAVVPWIAVFGVPSLTDAISDFLSCPLCFPNCYACKHLEIVHLQNLACGFLRCCAVIAGRDDAGGLCRWCGQLLPDPDVKFLRFEDRRGLHYRLVQNLIRLRRDMEMAAGLKVTRAEEQMGELSNQVARAIYLNHLFALERRCPSMQDYLETDDEDSPTF